MPLCEAVKENPGFHWRPQDVRDARVMGQLPRRAADWVWSQPKRKKDVPVKKAERTWRSEEHFDIRHGDAEFGICPAAFWHCFVPILPHYALFPPFQNGNVYSVFLYVGSMWFLILVLQEVTVKRLP